MGKEQSRQEAQELRLRLQSCLRTILDLREALDIIPFGESFLLELGPLEIFLENLAQINVTEDEVRRIELATALFLNELRPLLEKTRALPEDAGRVLQ